LIDKNSRSRKLTLFVFYLLVAICCSCLSSPEGKTRGEIHIGICWVVMFQLEPFEINRHTAVRLI